MDRLAVVSAGRVLTRASGVPWAWMMAAKQKLVSLVDYVLHQRHLSDQTADGGADGDDTDTNHQGG